MRPTLLLLPGILNDYRLWQHQIPALETEWELRFPKTHHRENISEIAEEILETAPEKFAMAGLSMGGYVALEMMRLAGNRVTHLALIASSARQDTPERKHQRNAMINLSKKGKFLGISPRLLPSIIAREHLDNPAVYGPILAMAETIGRKGFIRQETAAMSRRDQCDTLQAITCPTLVIVGNSDRLTPPHLSEEMHQGVAGSTFHMLEACGHLPPLEQPETVTRLMQQWLAQ